MESNNKYAVIGGTGKSGIYLINRLLSQEIPFRMLVRKKTAAFPSHALAEVLAGDIRNYRDCIELIRGCNAVLSTLGMGVPPGPPDLFSTATGNIIRAMAELAVDRYIVTTGLNVDAPGDRKGTAASMATAWMYREYPLSTADRQREYELLCESMLKWTLVRLPVITFDKDMEMRETTASLCDCVGNSINAGNLASFLVRQVADTRFICKAPFLFNR